jgi:hypothetical protein
VCYFMKKEGFGEFYFEDDVDFLLAIREILG